MGVKFEWTFPDSVIFCVKFEWTFPDSVIFLPHSYLVIAVWLFCCLHPGKSGRTEDGTCMENDFLSLIKTRRSVRAYQAEPVPAEALDAVLEAGTYAPTGGYRRRTSIPHHYCNYRPQI